MGLFLGICTLVGLCVMAPLLLKALSVLIRWTVGALVACGIVLRGIVLFAVALACAMFLLW